MPSGRRSTRSSPTCTFDGQIKLMRKVNKCLYLALCIIIFLLVQSITSSKLWREIFFYNIFMVAGYQFYKRIKIKTVLMVCFICLVGLVFFKDHFVPMQKHKFPPDCIFLLFSLFAIGLLYVVSQQVTLPNWRIFQIWNTRGYTMYIYQNIVFLIVSPIHMILTSKIPFVVGQFCFIAVLLFILSTLLSYLTYPLERYIMRKVHVLQ